MPESTEQSPDRTDAPPLLRRTPGATLSKRAAITRAPQRTPAHAGFGTSPLPPRPLLPGSSTGPRPIPHDLHIPTAHHGAATVTRAQRDEQRRLEGRDPIGWPEPAPAADDAFGS